MLDDRTKVRGDASGSAMIFGLSHDAKTLPDSLRCEWILDDPRAHASKHEGAAVPQAFMPQAREYLTQYSAVRWESREHTMGESKARGPHGGRAQEVVRARNHCLSLP